MPASATKLIFMGTPAFAVPSLEILHAHGYPIAAVVTAPDKPRGRGKQVVPSAIKIAAQAHQIPILQPTNLKDPDFLTALAGYNADLCVVVAFRMLPQVVWSMPRLGTFNLHASLLPAYRGAAPIHWAIIHGEQETGVTTFMIDEQIDTGSILAQAREPIYPQDTAETLHNRLQQKGAELVLKTVQNLAQGNYAATPQVPTPQDLLRKAPKIYKADCQIQWHQDAPAIANFIRGLSPAPAAWTTLNGQTYKILAAQVASGCPMHLLPGQVHTDGKHHIWVGTQGLPLALQTLQPSGKRPMDATAFLRGNQI